MRHLRFCVVAAAFLVLAGCAGGQVLPVGAEQESLRRHDRIKVVIEKLPQEAAAGGLSAERLQAIVEARLREAKIKTTGKPTPYLHVSLATLRVPEAESYATNVFLEFKQLVFFEPWLSAPAQYLGTWHTSRLKLLPESAYAPGVEQALDECMDDFMADWYAANEGYY